MGWRSKEDLGTKTHIVGGRALVKNMSLIPDLKRRAVLLHSFCCGELEYCHPRVEIQTCSILGFNREMQGWASEVDCRSSAV